MQTYKRKDELWSKPMATHLVLISKFARRGDKTVCTLTTLKVWAFNNLYGIKNTLIYFWEMPIFALKGIKSIKISLKRIRKCFDSNKHVWSAKIVFFHVQEWIYTHGQQIRQQQHCLSVSTTFPASQILLVPCNISDGKQVPPPLLSPMRMPEMPVTAHKSAHT